MLEIMKLNKLKQIIKEEIQKLQALNEAEIVTSHKPADDGGVYCRYTNTETGASSSFYLDEPPCPGIDEIDPPSAGTGVPVMTKIPGVARPVPVTTTPGKKPVRPQRPTRAPRADKRPGGSRPMPVNPQPRGGVQSLMGPMSGGGLTGANTPGGPRTR